MALSFDCLFLQYGIFVAHCLEVFILVDMHAFSMAQGQGACKVRGILEQGGLPEHQCAHAGTDTDGLPDQGVRGYAHEGVTAKHPPCKLK